jgi:hypothetical protein
LFNPDAVPRTALDNGIVNWERALGTQIRAYEARRPGDFEGVFAALARDGIGGLLVLADANTYALGSCSTNCVCGGAGSVAIGRC